MGVGFRLKRILRDRKMTIKQLAENANIPVNTLYSITKRDSERVDPVILRQLSETLEVPTSVLAGHGTPPDEAAEYAERMAPPEVTEDFKKAAITSGPTPASISKRRCIIYHWVMAA